MRVQNSPQAHAHPLDRPHVFAEGVYSTLTLKTEENSFGSSSHLRLLRPVCSVRRPPLRVFIVDPIDPISRAFEKRSSGGGEAPGGRISTFTGPVGEQGEGYIDNGSIS